VMSGGFSRVLVAYLGGAYSAFLAFLESNEISKLHRINTRKQFDPPSRHQDSKEFNSKMATPQRVAIFDWWLFWWLLAVYRAPPEPKRRFGRVQWPFAVAVAAIRSTTDDLCAGERRLPSDSDGPCRTICARSV